MEIKINREIREYKENMFFGLSLRQLVFSVLACGVAVGIDFGLRNVLGTETVSWLCILGAAPFAAMGFVKYHGMTAEKFVIAWVRSEFFDPQAADLQAEEFIPRSHAGSARQSPKTTLTLETWVHFTLSSKRHPTTPEGGKNAENTEKHPPQRYG